MASKIKTNTLDAQIEYIDQTVKDATGIDLKKFANSVVARREAVRKVGIQICKSIGFSEDGSIVLVRGGEISYLIH
jgi:hypothetical protein